ncbi:MAG: CPBP family intramembrane metalloprotease, partial [Oscillospiraceae bacterium]|nr:CPBP family intramembrane metalloprotease [Oscillospiraceae bacterium]
NKLLYYFLSVFLFGMAHLIIGFTFPTSFAFILSYALSAIGYIYVYEKSNNIWCPIFTHMLLNAVPVSLIIIML